MTPNGLLKRQHLEVGNNSPLLGPQGTPSCRCYCSPRSRRPSGRRRLSRRWASDAFLVGLPRFPCPNVESIPGQYPRCNSTGGQGGGKKAMNGTAEPWDYPSDNACTGETSDLFSAMGYSIRTDRWRYTLWLQWDGAKRDKVSWDAVHGEELYDHAGDDGFDTDKCATPPTRRCAALRAWLTRTVATQVRQREPALQPQPIRARVQAAQGVACRGVGRREAARDTGAVSPIQVPGFFASPLLRRGPCSCAQHPIES